MYLFPRDCPRILYWPLPTTTPEHREWHWLERMHTTSMIRYHLPPGTFEDLHDAGMWVSCETVRPSLVEPVGDLIEAVCGRGWRGTAAAALPDVASRHLGHLPTRLGDPAAEGAGLECRWLASVSSAARGHGTEHGAATEGLALM